ncbi:MAG: glycerol-3-phosphate dehydrogenase/oxidase [Deltaproteobacteria bacterium]|nr:glycerol-3-phosphate dehydrogenase/oxidase [Deltaproteobacteria bacterium]
MPADLDVLIIGGGSNGTGLCRDLAKRGARVLLCEKGDLARGATGGSSGMIHGGPRYLLNDVETTKHSCEDSGYIQRIVPHLLFRIPFLTPVEKKPGLGVLGPLLHDVYFGVYDRYAALKNGIPHARLTTAEMRAIEPGLAGDFAGGVTLDEWGIDCGRLCLLNAKDAIAHGATVMTYTEVVGLLQDQSGRVSGARLRSAGAAEVREVKARVVVNCGGPWAEKIAGLAGGGVRLRPGKGVHLIYEKRLTNFAVITSAVDGRQVFVLPYQNETWIGTTDDDYYGDLDDVHATQDEVRYLKEAITRILPGIAQQRLIGARVGVRNTIFGWGKNEDELSRRYDIVDHTRLGAPGLFSLLGGKLASFRVQAAETADAVCGALGIPGRCETHLHKLPGGDSMPDEAELARAYGVDRLAVRRLIHRHGSLAPRVLDVGRETPTGFSVVCAGEPTLECEVRHAVRHELVVRLGDLMTRCRIGVGACQGVDCGLRAAQIFAEERGLDPEDEREALMDLLSRRWRAARPVLTGLQLAEAELLMTQYTGLWQLPALVPHA